MRKLLLGLIILSCLTANAKSTFPAGCKPIHFNFAGNQLNLNTAGNSQKVFLLQNISSQKIWVDHKKKSPSASAGWGSELNSNKWSAIALKQNQPNFVITCSSANFKLLQCKKLLQVCELQNVTGQALGSYWIAENQSLTNVLEILRKRGFNFSA